MGKKKGRFRCLFTTSKKQKTLATAHRHTIIIYKESNS